MAERSRSVGFGMTGESNLKVLLREMKPQVVPGEFVFCAIDSRDLQSLGNTPLLTYRESEGITVVIPKEVAVQHSLSFENTWGLLTLSVHSDLEAVGLLATVTNALADSEISVNVVSAYFHDHLFVPYSKVHDALQILEEIPESKAK
jgi:hypothetical protein